MMKRRHFLRAGSLALALPWLPSLEAKADATRPSRIVFLLSSCGVTADAWFPRQTGREFTLHDSLSPLVPFQDRIAVIKGLNNTSALSQGGNPHTKAGAHTLTGSAHILPQQFVSSGGGSFSTGISIDQKIAAELSTPETLIPSLLTGISIGRGSGTETPRARFNYAGHNMPLEPMGSASRVLERLLPYTRQAEDAQATLQRLGAERRSVLDLAMGDIAELKTRLGSADRRRLDNHLTHLRALEASIAAQDTSSAMVCESPDDLGEGGGIQGDTRRMLDLIAFAVRCNLTQVATFVWAGAQSSIRYNFLDGVTTAGGHHTISHTDGSEYTSQMSRIARFHAGELAYFLQQLDGFEEGEGTVLDNTLVVFLNTLSNGRTHDLRDIPMVLAGSSCLNLGQSLQLNGRSLNDLHLTLASVMGVELESFGDPEHVTGRIDQLIA